ncbi:dihydropteroate synthase [Salinisphaera sp. T31B1]|uniref:dihydropteroate synthase n=1 Tax=Salinisphaera sp. T31B1 TaxID=727963 RepID=UPI00333F50BD
MGIVNVTPDSFSDGGAYVDTAAAVAHALALIDQGAAIVDIGGESTRPGAEPVDEEVECARVVPVIEALRRQSDVFISVDTLKPGVMRAACMAGADMVNDVNALQAPGAIDAVRETGAAACLMHMQGQPRTMQQAPVYGDVVGEVAGFLRQRVASCFEAGIARERLCIDPGFGFGKTLDHNLALLRELDRFTHGDRPVLVGVSRKSMFARLLDTPSMDARIHASVAAAFWAATRQARIIRCHDVAPTVQVLRLAQALGPHETFRTGQ